MGKVDHIRRIAAAGAHVDLQRDELTLFADMLVARQTEKLKVNEAALHPEALDRGAAEGAGVLRQLLEDVVQGVVAVVDDVHDGDAGDVARFEQRLAPGVDDGVIGIDLAVDKLLHDIGEAAVARGQEGVELLLVFQLIGSHGADAVVRLDDDRPAHLLDKGAAARRVADHMEARGGDPGAAVIFLHAGFVLDARHVFHTEAAGDVEIAAKMGVLLEPVFVVRLEKIDPPVFEDEERDRAVYLVVVLKRGDLVVFRQAAFELEAQLVIGLVADAEDVDAVAAQLMAELPVVHGEIRRDKDYVFHNDRFFLLLKLLQKIRHKTGHLLEPPRPIVRNVIAPVVHSGRDALFHKHAVQRTGIIRQLPGTLPHADDRAMSAVQREERVVIRHVGKVMHRGVEIDRLVHVAAEAVFRVVDAAERKQLSKASG